MLAHGHGSNVFVKAHLVNLFAKKGGDSGAVYARNISEKKCCEPEFVAQGVSEVRRY